MQFKTNSNNLLKGLSQVVGVITPNNTLPILDNLHLSLVGNELTITGSDLEITITSKIEVDGGNDGAICVGTKTLLDLLKTMNNESILFASTQNVQVIIQATQGYYEISYDDANDFPSTPTLSEETQSISSNELKNVITKTIFATGNDELRPIMMGVCFESGKVASTDAHKLVKVTTNINANFVLPKKGANLLKNLLPKDDVEVEMQYNTTNALFTFDNISVIVRLVDGKYPNYEAAIPQNNNNKLSIGRVEFINTLKRLQAFSNKTTNQVRLDLNQDEVIISSEDVDFRNKAKETLNAVYSGSNLSIGFNSKFMIEMLSNINCEEVSLDMSEPNRAILVNGEENVLGLLMPVMLNA